MLVQPAAHTPTDPAPAAGRPTRPAPGPADESASDPSAPDPSTGRVAADRRAGAVPTAVRLPAADVLAPVVPVGVQPDGLLAVPDPPRTVGWWRDGALPGAPTGTAVLVGHVDSASAGIGAFAALWHAAVGDPVLLTAADGSVLRYQVQARRSYPKQGLPADVFDRAGPPRLVLITCGGVFDAATRHYTDNVVVYATPVTG